MRDNEQAVAELRADVPPTAGPIDQALVFTANLLLAVTGAFFGLVIGYIVAIVLGLAEFTC